MQRYVKNTLRQGSFAFLTRPALTLVPNLLPEKYPFPYPANTPPILYLYSVNIPALHPLYPLSTPPPGLFDSWALRPFDAPPPKQPQEHSILHHFKLQG